MVTDRGVEMAEEELYEFLGPGGTGVVSFATGSGEPPYSIPVSYGFDAVGGDLYFRLAVEESSEKAAHVEAPVSFVVSERTEGRWGSVVATGRLTPIEEAALDTDVLAAMSRTDIPLVDVFDRHPRKLVFRFFRLEIDRVSGRREVLTED